MSERPVRSFVAVLLPEGVRARLTATVSELRLRAPALAWVRTDNLHLTVRFLGDLEPRVLVRVREALEVAATAVAPFTVEVGALGGFPDGRPPRIVWAGVVVGREELVELHAALESALVARGIPGESRPFHPHVTLARARDRRGAPRLEGLLGPGPRFGQLKVAALHLMRSELGPGGSRYGVLGEARLGAPGGRGQGGGEPP